MHVHGYDQKSNYADTCISKMLLMSRNTCTRDTVDPLIHDIPYIRKYTSQRLMDHTRKNARFQTNIYEYDYVLVAVRELIRQRANGSRVWHHVSLLSNDIFIGDNTNIMHISLVRRAILLIILLSIHDEIIRKSRLK